MNQVLPRKLHVPGEDTLTGKRGLLHCAAIQYECLDSGPNLTRILISDSPALEPSVADQLLMDGTIIIPFQISLSKLLLSWISTRCSWGNRRWPQAHGLELGLDFA